MRARGDCPECRLRDVACIVQLDDGTTIRLCAHCASAYEPRSVQRLPS